MSGLFDKMGESIRGVTEGLSKGREAYVIGAEKRLRVERIKININNLRKEKDDQMQQMAHLVYEKYTQGTLSDPDLLAACQKIKMLQWQIDEGWTEINALNEEKEK